MAEAVVLKAALNIGAATGIGAFADFLCQQIEIHIGGRQAVEKRAEQDADDASGDEEEVTEEGVPIHVRKHEAEDWKKALLCRGRVYMSEEHQPTSPVSSPVAAWPHARQRYDCNRTCRFAVSFGVLGGANSFVWYNYILPPLSQHKFWPMVAWDMCFYNAYFTIVGLTANECMRPRRRNDGGELVDKDGRSPLHAACVRFVPTFALASAVLFPADLVMFGVIPREWRVVFVKSVDVLWMTGASYLANRPLDTDDSPEDAGD
eukprot:TRINITY_DN48001_c0_g1_i1.p2 TRINITY_DN48001_c0_g1~~TRINITY_DN48001_c0_g1_i1.p2  ORF type:complete len:262 (+),score=85.19 TRINITY_DN48001_c0_g1_i1:82-867(+)